MCLHSGTVTFGFFFFKDGSYLSLYWPKQIKLYVIRSSNGVKGIKKSKIRNVTQTIEQIIVAIFMFISFFSFSLNR